MRRRTAWSSAVTQENRPRTRQIPKANSTVADATVIARMRIALSEMVVEGIKTNIPLHQELLLEDSFLRGGTSIHYLEQRMAKRKSGA